MIKYIYRNRNFGMYAEVYEMQLRNAKKEQETINELLTLGLIRKMLAREAREAS